MSHCLKKGVEMRQTLVNTGSSLHITPLSTFEATTHCIATSGNFRIWLDTSLAPGYVNVDRGVGLSNIAWCQHFVSSPSWEGFTSKKIILCPPPTINTLKPTGKGKKVHVHAFGGCLRSMNSSEWSCLGNYLKKRGLLYPDHWSSLAESGRGAWKQSEEF